MSTKISGSKYAAMYGPTTGDKVRLADTSLVIEVEKDYTTYGDEVKFGGGKTIRDGMGQSVKTCSKDGDLDLVITNALIVDSTGIVKADIGIKDGKIAGIGKAGNPDIMDGVTPGMTVGASTEALAGEGMIVTAGGIDTHIHFISPQQIDCALYSGVTTMIGGGTGPADGTNATTCTPGPWNLKMMLKAAEEYPMNLGFLGKGNCSDEAPLIEQVKAGAMGLKIHEDWGATPAVINHCLNVADEYDVQVAIHTDTLNEGGCVEDTLAAIGGRTIHTYHTEGAGGGHAPDIIRAAAAPNVLPSSTNPTMPYTVNTLDEHLDMLEMLSAMEQERSAGHTSCPTPDAWLAQFEQADCAIAITISSQLSGSMNSALAARDMALEKDPDKKIVILDSLSTGPEVLLCVKEIERLIRQGLSFDDIAAHARGFLQKTKILFALSSFDNLIKNGRIHRLTGMLAKALGIWGIGSGSDEGKIAFESKARGAKKVVQTLVSTMKEHGFIGGNVAISHCDNLALAQTLKNSILDIWENTSIEILPTRGLCSYYAERGGLIVSY